MAAEGHTGEHAKEICGAIKAGTANARMCWGKPCDVDMSAPQELEHYDSGLTQKSREAVDSGDRDKHLEAAKAYEDKSKDVAQQDLKAKLLSAGAAHRKQATAMLDTAPRLAVRTKGVVPGVTTRNQADELSWGECVLKEMDGGLDRTSAENLCSQVEGETYQENHMKIPAQAIANLKHVLTANCKCGGAEKAANNKALADEVAKLKDKIQTDALNRGAKAVLNIQQGQLVINAEGEAAGVDIAKLAKFLAIDINPGSDPAGFIKSLLAKLDEISKQLSQPEDLTDAGADEGSEAPTPVAMAEGGPDATTNRSRLTPEEREAIAFANSVRLREKQAIVNRLVANVEDDGQRQAAFKELMAMPDAALQRLAPIAPAQTVANTTEQDHGGGHWVGMTGNANPVLTRNQSQVSDRERAEIEAMTPPVLNFRKERQKQSA